MFHPKSFSRKSFSTRSWRFAETEVLFGIPPIFRPLRRKAVHRPICHASTFIGFEFSISSQAGLAIVSYASTDIAPDIAATSRLGISSIAEISPQIVLDAHADAVDVVLEAVMMAA